MTRDEIHKMHAGRETDALIAEIIMGWTWDGFDGGYQRLSFSREGHRRYGAIREGGETEYTNNLPEFSTDMGDAWEVIQHFLGTSRKRPKIDRVAENEWRVQINDWNENAVAYSSSAPLAICRAALLAVMEDK